MSDQRSENENKCHTEINEVEQIINMDNHRNKEFIVQINLKKSINHTHQLVNQMNKHKLNVAAVQEPYSFKDVDGHFRIKGFGRDFDVLECESENSWS